MGSTPDSTVNNDGTETHINCGGDIHYFKEGWICCKCKEGDEYPWQAASTVPTGSTVSASSATQARPQDAPGAASTEAPSTSGRLAGMAQGTDGLQSLVAQHFANLDAILANTIDRLNALRDQIPAAMRDAEALYPTCPACLKIHNPPFRFACDTTDSIVDSRVHDSGGRSPNVGTDGETPE